MNRILILLAAGCACWSTAAGAQSGTPKEQPVGSAASGQPSQSGGHGLLKGVVKGLVGAAVKEAVRKANSPKPEAAPQAQPAAAVAPATPAVAEPAVATTPAPPASAPAPVAQETIPIAAAPTLPAPTHTSPIADEHSPGRPPPEPAHATPAVEAATPAASPAAAPPAALPQPVARRPAPAEQTQSLSLWLRLWPIGLLLLAMAVGATWLKRARLLRTKKLLSLEPRFDRSIARGTIGPLTLASPPVSIRARLELRSAHG